MISYSQVNSLGLRYDYDSIMHYARNTFSKVDSNTVHLISSKQKRNVDLIGLHYSFYEVQLSGNLFGHDSTKSRHSAKSGV